MKRYGLFGLPYTFMLTLNLFHRISLKNKLVGMGTKGIVVELENKKPMLLDPCDLGLSYDILLNEKKLRENYASEYLLNTLGKEDVFFDLGTNLGYYTVLLSDHFKRIICVEPVPSNVKFIEKNVILNNIADKTTIINCAVAPCDGEVFFEDNERKNLVQISKEGKGNKINAYTIETICKKSNIKSIDFLKMDLEGYEYEIIVEGNDSFVKYAPKRMFVEIHFNLLETKKSELILKTLEKNGYAVEAAFIEVKDILYLLRKTRKIYQWYFEKFIIGKKIGIVYKNVEISEILKDKKMIQGDFGAIEFIFIKKSKS